MGIDDFSSLERECRLLGKSARIHASGCGPSAEHGAARSMLLNFIFMNFIYLVLRLGCLGVEGHRYCSYQHRERVTCTLFCRPFNATANDKKRSRYQSYTLRSALSPTFSSSHLTSPSITASVGSALCSVLTLAASPSLLSSSTSSAIQPLIEPSLSRIFRS